MLQLKDHDSSQLYKFNFLCAVCEIIETWAKSSVGTCQFLRLLEVFWWIQGQMKLKGWWLYHFFSFDVTIKASISSSITIYKISGTSCWLLKWTDDRRSLVILFLKAQKKLEGSINNQCFDAAPMEAAFESLFWDVPQNH